MGRLLNYEIGNACNLRCTFCYNDSFREDRQFFKDIDTINKELNELKKDEITGVTIIGGEPLFHPDFFKITEIIKSIGYEEIYLITNGVKLSNKDFSEKVMKIPILKGIVFSIHSHKDKLEDLITGRKNILKKKIQGIKNIKSIIKSNNKNIYININLLLLKTNIYYLSDIIEYFYKNSLYEIRLYCMHIHLGMTEKNLDSIPKYSNVIHSIKKIENINKIQLSIHRSPLCISSLTPKGILIREVSKRYLYNVGVGGEKLFDSQIREKVKTDECVNCYAYGRFCFGVYKKYIDKYGYSEFKRIGKEKLKLIIKGNLLLEKNK